MWRPFSSQLQGMQALLSAEGMLCSNFVGRLCGGDVNLCVLGGTLSCRDKNSLL